MRERLRHALSLTEHRIDSRENGLHCHLGGGGSACAPGCRFGFLEISLNPSPAFQFYPADILADDNCCCMTARQIGAYWLLCCHAWRSTHVGRLLNDPYRLARLGRLTDQEWTEDGKAILAAFDTSDPKWIIQRRLVKEWKKQQARRNQMVTAGKASAKKRATQVQHTLDSCSTENQHNGNSSSSITSLSSVYTSKANRAKAVFGEDGAVKEVGELMGLEEMEKNGGLYRIMFREDSSKFLRVLAETQNAAKENRIRETKGAYFMFTWKEFK